jgi:hypothetical protein
MRDQTVDAGVVLATLPEARLAGGHWREWGRLILLAAAVGLAAVAYRSHVSIDLPWWRWVVELGIAWALFIAALASGGPPSPEPGVRRWLRRVSGGISILAVALAVWAGLRPGSEGVAIMAAMVALTAFFAARWVPFQRADVEALIGCGIDEADQPRTWSRGTLVLASSAVALCAAAILLNRWSHAGALVLWLGSLGLLPLAVRNVDRPTSRAVDAGWQNESGPLLSRGAAAMAVLLVLALAFGLRFVALSEIPSTISIDEGHLGRHAETLWKEGFPDPFGIGWNSFAHLSYLVGYTGVQIFGTSNWSLRLVSVVFGVLSLVPAYFWMRRWWGNVVAIIGIVLLAINGEHIYWSRLALNNVHQFLLAGLVLAAFARALQTRRLVDWIWLGYAIGFGFHTYHAAKLYPALVLGAGLLLAVGIGGIARRYVPGVLAAALAFLLVVVPLLPEIWSQWERWSSDNSNRLDISQLFEAHAAGNHEVVRRYVDDHVYSSVRNFINEPSKLALLAPFVSAPFLLGVGWMAWRWRDPRHLFALAWMGGILAAAAATSPPRLPRLLGVLPVACLIPALVAGRIRSVLHRCLPIHADVLAVPLLGLWLLGAAVHAWDAEFVYRASARHVTTEVCRLLERVETPATFYSAGVEGSEDPRVASSICMVADDPQRFLVNLPADAHLVPIPPINRGTAVLLVFPPQRELLPLVRHYYPDVEPEVFSTWDKTPIMWAFVMRPHVVDSHRGLRATYRSTAAVVAPGEGHEALVAPEGSQFPVQARGEGLVWIPLPGAYRFRSDGGMLRIDGLPVTDEASVVLAAGWHAVEVTGTLGQTDDRISIEWKVPEDSEWRGITREMLLAHPGRPGLLGRYFGREIAAAGAAPIEGKPDYDEIVPALSFDWFQNNDDLPLAPFGARGATMEWYGTIDLPEGQSHRLRLEATTPAQVFVDGVLVVESVGGDGSTPIDAVVTTRASRVPFLVRSLRPAGDAWHRWKLRVLWQAFGNTWSAAAAYRPPEREAGGPQRELRRAIAERGRDS